MIKASRRTKKRYIAIKGNFNNKEISDYLLEFFGVKDFGKINLKIIKIKEELNGIKIIRVNRAFYYEVLGALSLTQKETTGFRVIPIKSSGSIKGLLKSFNSNENL